MLSLYSVNPPNTQISVLCLEQNLLLLIKGTDWCNARAIVQFSWWGLILVGLLYTIDNVSDQYSEVMIDHLTVSNCSGDDSTGLWAGHVVGSFFILNSSGTLYMDYSFWKLPTILNLINNTLITALNACEEAILDLSCSNNIHTVIADVQFGMESLQGQCGLDIYLNTPTWNNSVVISNFNNGPISVITSEKCTTCV